MWFSPPSSPTMRPSSLEQESGGLSVLCQNLPEEPSGEVCVSGHPPLGGAEVWSAFVREVEAVPALGLCVSTVGHTEPRESVGALRVCLGCHIQLFLSQSSITWASVDNSILNLGFFPLNKHINCPLSFLCLLVSNIKFTKKTACFLFSQT